jgi:3-oxoacyl-(acyl-carrier-protein) synthase
MKTYLTRYNTLSTEYSEVLDDVAYPQRVHWFSDSYDKVKTGLVYVPHLLAEKVITEELVEYVKNNPVNGKTGFILAGGSQGWAGGNSKHRDIENRFSYTYKMGMLTMTNIFAGRTASMFEAYDHVSTDASACASGIKTMMDVKNLIDNYGFDRVIVLALEDAVCNMTIEFFGQMKASLSKRDEEEGKIVSAFDNINGGFNIGQGASIAIFESLNAINKNQVIPEAELLGAYMSAEEMSNPIGQRPDGQGYQRAIVGALGASGRRAKDIKLVKTHGTGTPTNNLAERNALQTILPEFIATSYKQYIGHTVAASGLLETGLILNDIKSGSIRPIKNRTEKDDVFISEPAGIPGGLLLTLGAGMGNIYAAAILDYQL